LIHDTFQITSKKKFNGVRSGDLRGSEGTYRIIFSDSGNDWGTSDSKYFAHYEHNEEGCHLVASTGVV